MLVFTYAVALWSAHFLCAIDVTTVSALSSVQQDGSVKEDTEKSEFIF